MFLDEIGIKFFFLEFKNIFRRNLKCMKMKVFKL